MKNLYLQAILPTFQSGDPEALILKINERKEILKKVGDYIEKLEKAEKTRAEKDSL